MISGSLKNINAILPYVSLRLGMALVYIRDTDFSDLANGEYEVSGREVFARVNTYDTEPKEIKKQESHNEYIDVQFLAKGKERIGYCDLESEHKIIEDYAKERDLLFYEKTAKENFIDLEKGDWAVFFPWEIHRPGCSVDENASAVKKIVVKVKIGG